MKRLGSKTSAQAVGVAIGVLLLLHGVPLRCCGVAGSRGADAARSVRRGPQASAAGGAAVANDRDEYGSSFLALEPSYPFVAHTTYPQPAAPPAFASPPPPVAAEPWTAPPAVPQNPLPPSTPYTAYTNPFVSLPSPFGLTYGPLPQLGGSSLPAKIDAMPYGTPLDLWGGPAEGKSLPKTAKHINIQHCTHSAEMDLIVSLLADAMKYTMEVFVSKDSPSS